MVSANHHQTGILTSSTRIGLQRNSCKTSNRRQIFGEFVDHLHIPFGLIGRDKRVNIPKLGPAQRHHGNSRIQFHRARTQRDHAVGQRNITMLQLLDVTHHVGFAVVFFEDRFGQIGRCTLQTLSDMTLFYDLFKRSKLLACSLRKDRQYGIDLCQV